MFATRAKHIFRSLNCNVSIPFRGFRCLQLVQDDFVPFVAMLFQSLSGVLDVCNTGTRLKVGSLIFCFNPFQGF